MCGGGIPRAARTVVSDEICATIIDYVINHSLSLREAGERVQPNLRQSTVACMKFKLELWKTKRYLTISIASASQPLHGHCQNTECG